jgi:DNA primase
MKFKRDSLPPPLDFYRREFPQLFNKTFSKKWISVICCFHTDKHPSLSINLDTGAFRCFACGIKGRDIIAFAMLRYGLCFAEAVRLLGE